TSPSGSARIARPSGPRRAGGRAPGPARKNGGAEAATGRELAFDDTPFGLHGIHQVAKHFVDGVFVKDAEVAVSKQVHFQGLQLDAGFARLVLNGDGAIVGQAGLRAHGRVFGKAGGDDIVRILVGPDFQLG